MYKKRLRDCNLRKNIRSTKSEAQAYQHMFNTRERPAQVRLSNGQVVATDLLATHVQRKMNRIRAPAMVRAPDRYHFMESAYLHTRLYLVSRPPSSHQLFEPLLISIVCVDWPLRARCDFLYRSHSRCYTRGGSVYTKMEQIHPDTRRCA